MNDQKKIKYLEERIEISRQALAGMRKFSVETTDEAMRIQGEALRIMKKMISMIFDLEYLKFRVFLDKEMEEYE